MSDKTTPTIGKILTEEMQRDAVHFAVAPMIAAERLSAGLHVGLTAEGKASRSAEHVGIVDPFLVEVIEPGDRFWMFLYPQTITSLRHEWTHPAFERQRAKLEFTKGESESWLRLFCETSDCPGYDAVIAAASGEPLEEIGNYGEAYNRWDEYLHFNGRDAHGPIPPEFWEHVEVVTGKKIPEANRSKKFSCCC